MLWLRVYSVYSHENETLNEVQAFGCLHLVSSRSHQSSWTECFPKTVLAKITNHRVHGYKCRSFRKHYFFFYELVARHSSTPNLWGRCTVDLNWDQNQSVRVLANLTTQHYFQYRPPTDNQFRSRAAAGRQTAADIYQSANRASQEAARLASPRRRLHASLRDCL